MERKTNAFWGGLTVLIVLFALALCFYGMNRGVLFARPAGNPQSSVIGFFNALKAGDEEEACRYVDNYSSLGLGNVPESEEGQLMFSALKRSYDYSLSESVALSGTRVSQKVLVKYLDLELVDQAARALTELSYNSALRQVLLDPESCCTTEFYDIPVTYADGKWLMTLNGDLLSALQGGR